EICFTINIIRKATMSKLLFEIPDIHWSDVIPKMFDHKLTSLSICNYACPSYLPKSARMALIKSLTSISDKEIYFASSMERISTNAEGRQFVNDYRVEETNSTANCYMSTFLVTHKKREPIKLFQNF
ncbi:hypothetical protein PFISCL1PPCAC_16382, partial [Pristionchus fissidentatus]